MNAGPCRRLGRRHFVHGSLAATAALLGLKQFPHALYAAQTKKNPQDLVRLGRTGLEVSRLAQGTGTNGFGGTSNQVKLGIPGLAELLRAGVDDGLNFWDTADEYGSHPAVKEALKTVSRDKVVVMTKLEVKDAAKMREDLDRTRREMGVDVIDIVLMHCMWAEDWPKRFAAPMEVLSEAKQKGQVRAVGVSCHTLRALKASLACDWVDVQLARFNPVGVEMDADPEVVRGVLQEMKAKGKGVLGMKILGAGFLKEEVDPALQFALASPLDAFTIGADGRAQMEQLVKKIPAASVRG